MLLDGDITEKIIGAAIEVHRTVGPGLLESAYEAFFVRELELCGMDVKRQIELPVEYKGCRIECGLRIDLLVNQRVIIELKAIEKTLPIPEAQLLTYLKLSGLKT